MFYAKSPSNAEWRAIAAAIKTLVEEATFEASNEALIFRAMDPSHIALVDLSWPAVAFERFECDKPFKFSVRVEDFVKLIGRSDTKDSVEISSTEEDALIFKLMNGYKREFKVHLIESVTATAPLPKLEFDAKAQMSKNVFEKVLSDISVVADQVTIHASKEAVSFAGKSDIGAASVQLEKGGADVLDLTVTQESKATYSVDYLSSISKAVGSASDTVIFSFSAKKPILLEWKLNEHGTIIRYFLAPRIAES